LTILLTLVIGFLLFLFLLLFSPVFLGVLGGLGGSIIVLVLLGVMASWRLINGFGRYLSPITVV